MPARVCIPMNIHSYNLAKSPSHLLPPVDRWACGELHQKWPHPHGGLCPVVQGGQRLLHSLTPHRPLNPLLQVSVTGWFRSSESRGLSNHLPHPCGGGAESWREDAGPVPLVPRVRPSMAFRCGVSGRLSEMRCCLELHSGNMW